MFWNVNVNGARVFSCARRGNVVCSIELPNADSDGLPSPLASLHARAAEGSADLVAIAAVMVEQFTGVQLDADTVNGVRTRHPIVEPLEPVRYPGSELVALGLPSAELVSRVQSATPAVRRDLAEWATTQVADWTGLSTRPDVQVVLANFGSHQTATLSVEASRLLTEVEREDGPAEMLLSSGDWDEMQWAHGQFPWIGRHRVRPGCRRRSLPCRHRGPPDHPGRRDRLAGLRLRHAPTGWPPKRQRSVGGSSDRTPRNNSPQWRSHGARAPRQIRLMRSRPQRGMNTRMALGVAGISCEPVGLWR